MPLSACVSRRLRVLSGVRVVRSEDHLYMNHTADERQETALLAKKRAVFVSLFVVVGLFGGVKVLDITGPFIIGS